MLKSYQSIYVAFYRWTFKNFGQGKMPQFKSLFNVSFLLIIVLTTALLLTQIMVRSQLFVITANTETAIIAGAVFFMLINHLILLNNKWFRKINDRMAILSRHNLNTWSVVVLINVIIVCGFLLFTVK